MEYGVPAVRVPAAAHGRPGVPRELPGRSAEAADDGESVHRALPGRGPDGRLPRAVQRTVDQHPRLAPVGRYDRAGQRNPRPRLAGVPGKALRHDAESARGLEGCRTAGRRRLRHAASADRPKLRPGRDGARYGPLFPRSPAGDHRIPAKRGRGVRLQGTDDALGLAAVPVYDAAARHDARRFESLLLGASESMGPQGIDDRADQRGREGGVFHPGAGGRPLPRPSLSGFGVRSRLLEPFPS